MKLTHLIRSSLNYVSEHATVTQWCSFKKKSKGHNSYSRSNGTRSSPIEELTVCKSIGWCSNFLAACKFMWKFNGKSTGLSLAFTYAFHSSIRPIKTYSTIVTCIYTSIVCAWWFFYKAARLFSFALCVLSDLSRNFTLASCEFNTSLRQLFSSPFFKCLHFNSRCSYLFILCARACVCICVLCLVSRNNVFHIELNL